MAYCWRALRGSRLSGLPFPADTPYFGPGLVTSMINYRVNNLDAMLAQMQAAGAQVEDRIEHDAYGRFGWASDPAGNRFELWEPKGMTGPGTE